MNVVHNLVSVRPVAGEECLICQENIDNSEIGIEILAHVVNAAVRHVFCAPCINRWLGTNHNTCPACRIKISWDVQSLFRAARQGDPEIVTAFLTNRPLTEQIRGQAVEHAVYGGHLHIVNLLTASGSLLEENRIHAIEMAAESGQQEVVASLLAVDSQSNWDLCIDLLGYETLFEGRYDLAASYAGQNGHEEIVRMLGSGHRRFLFSAFKAGLLITAIFAAAGAVIRNIYPSYFNDTQEN